MFERSLDKKGTYVVDDMEVVDITDTIFDPNVSMTQLCSIYRASKEFEMRPDLLSKALYGSTDYVEMILKYSLIDNPFSLEKDDIIYSASLSSIYNPVKETEFDTTGAYDAVKNYHKYIDKSKVPTQKGSDKNNTKISSGNTQNGGNNTEANISKTGDTGIVVKNGKIYFGAIDDTITAVDSSIVECAADGVTLGEFLNKTLRNSI